MTTQDDKPSKLTCFYKYLRRWPLSVRKEAAIQLGEAIRSGKSLVFITAVGKYYDIRQDRFLRMKKTVWKFTLDHHLDLEFLRKYSEASKEEIKRLNLDGFFHVAEVEMPKEAQILSVREQKGHICLWALVNPDAENEKRHFRIFATGRPIPKDEGKIINFLGTVHFLDGELVYHVFEVMEADPCEYATLD